MFLTSYLKFNEHFKCIKNKSEMRKKIVSQLIFKSYSTLNMAGSDKN